MEIVPETTEAPALGIAPYAAQIYTDLDRDRDFVRLFYRHKRPGLVSDQLTLLDRVLADLTAAGIEVADTVTVRLGPQLPAPANNRLYRIDLEVPVAVPDAPAWVAALRANLVRKKGK